ncbi:hypothetical protein F5Y04DRAFT_199330 [Hypomontagnella monticulosa]|nr:hypothetical protein F5Y04DRAFT_199330 [Hypomontagnella monticulosa]
MTAFSSLPQASPSGSAHIRQPLWLSTLTRLSHYVLFYVLIFIAIRGAASSQDVLPPSESTCVSRDARNQHAQQYPELVSGNLNGTTLIVPISLDTARRLIPTEYAIVEKAYRTLLPSFPDGMYPMVAQIVHDHDIQVFAYNMSLSDFTRASFEFPFLDIFGDGYTSFRWTGTSMISASNTLAIEGAEGYGMTVHPASFNPPCDAYKALPGGAMYASSRSSNETRSKFMTLETRPSLRDVPYPLSFIQNVTNQPVFSDTKVCDYYLRLFNSTLADTATPVVGKVSANLEPFSGPQSWNGIYGWRVATPFLEPPLPSECSPTA